MKNKGITKTKNTIKRTIKYIYKISPKYFIITILFTILIGFTSAMSIWATRILINGISQVNTNPNINILKILIVYASINIFIQLIQSLNNYISSKHQLKMDYKMKNVTSIESMKQMTAEFNTEECINNVAKVLGYDELEELPHHDTINNFLKKLNPIDIEKIRKYMIKELFKKRCLEQYRLLDKYWTIAVDATGLVSFDERHCDHCLKREYINKETGEIKKNNINGCTWVNSIEYQK